MKIRNIILTFCVSMAPRSYLAIAFRAKSAVTKMKIIGVKNIKKKPRKIKKACHIDRLDEKPLKLWAIFHLIFIKVEK